ncbi:MAG: tRNA-binding protein [Bdellovibrionales bacterium]|nr:tRNA-binding protein [Bdellovibrionales bacterium]
MHVNHSANSEPEPEIGFDDFMKVDIRVGTIKSAEVFKEARKPAYILMIDFGDPIGIKKSSAQITEHYDCENLPGKKVAAVVNFAARQIGPIRSEVLTLGFPDEQGRVVLFSPDQSVPNGARLF